MPFTPHGRIGGAGRRVSREKLRDPEQPPEFYRPVFPCSTRDGCGRRGNSEFNRQEVASGGVHSER